MSKSPLSTEETLNIQQMISYAEGRQYYLLLGIAEDSSTDSIREAYYNRSRNWHPDRFFRKELGIYRTSIEEIFMRLTEAHSILTDSGTRRAYDREQKIDSVARSERIRRSVRSSRRKGKKRREFEQSRQTENSVEAKTALRNRRREKVLGNIRENIQTQERRAAHFYELAIKDIEQHRPIKAASSLHIACKLEPSNKKYQEKYKEIKQLARSAQSTDFFVQAENAESFQNYQEALSKYRKAIEYGIQDARAYARLSYLMERLDPDPRETLRLMRYATQLEDDNAEYRCILGEMYAREGLVLNARREYQAALEIEKNYQRAKDGLKAL